MSKTTRVLRVVAAGAMVALAIATRRHRRWGATTDEADGPLPGDELVADPTTQATRAITIGVRAERVWPWIAQLGGDRGGFYSYDWLENHFGFLMGGPADLGIHSATEIVADWQERRVGDLVASDAYGLGGWYVVSFERNGAMVVQMADVKRGAPARRDVPPYTEFSWAFVLRERVDGTTRLIVRERVGAGNALARAMARPIGLISHLMTRKMLIGIKQRAERAGDGAVGATATAGPDRVVKEGEPALP